LAEWILSRIKQTGEGRGRSSVTLTALHLAHRWTILAELRVAIFAIQR